MAHLLRNPTQLRVVIGTVLALAVSLALALEQKAEAECQDSASQAVCAAFQRKAEKAKELANGDRTQWEKVAFLLIDNPPPTYYSLPNGTVLNIYTGQTRQTALSSHSSRSENVASQKVAAQWRRYMEMVHRHHAQGTLTYDMYRCRATCEGHQRGFKWAEANQAREYAHCKGDSQSFIEGCAVWVTRAKGLVVPESR
jgi:hypothetical protein